MNISIRDASVADAKRLAEIYAYYVENTAVSFEYVPPSAEEFGHRIKGILEKYPYLVCERDGEIIGYAYASAYSAREAYCRTAAASVYVDRAHRREGAGTLLYAALEERLRSQGIVNLLAGVAYSAEEDEHLSHDSKNFHLAMGFEQAAHLKGRGIKFGKWYDLLWFQKRL